MISRSRQGVRFVTGICFCILWYLTAHRGTICYGHGVLHLVVSHSRQEVQFVTGLVRAWGSASSGILQ